jgi:hypothetical protein
MPRIEHPSLELVTPGRAIGNRADREQQPSWTAAARCICLLALASWGALLMVLALLL